MNCKKKTKNKKIKIIQLAGTGTAYVIAISHKRTNKCRSSVEYRHLILIDNVP